MEIEILKLKLLIDQTLTRRDAEKVRGYLGQLFWDEPFAHHHTPDGKLIFQYPCVQYKVVDGACLVIGFGQGMSVVEQTFYKLKEIVLDDVAQEILTQGLEKCRHLFSLSRCPVKYTFLTPWLALNEENYEKYKGMKSWGEKETLLKKILIGNIISVAKGVGYVIPDKIVVSRLKVFPTRTPVRLKGVGMTAFLGEFAVNFELPDYFGLGESVSRGFGTIKRIE